MKETKHEFYNRLCHYNPVGGGFDKKAVIDEEAAK